MYNHKEIEQKWIKYWEDNNTFYTNAWDFSKPKFYTLCMFPYPSAEGLHVGHPESYTATDILARMKRMQGYNVLNPIGFDSFGLPAEQFAIKTNNNPAIFTERNIKNFTNQLKMLGFSYDWSKQVSTADPKFYKWTQWIFTQLYKDGYAKYIDTTVNWCEELGTVLANDEIIDGKSERGGFPVVKKLMKQWVIDTPKFAEELLQGLDELPDWPESTKEMQRNWIGKSEGAEVEFNVSGTKYKFVVFTTRADTLFGATYCVLSPEHELVLKISTDKQLQQVKDYIRQAQLKSDLERTDLNKDKTGVFTGAYAINPVNQKEIPIYIADYVLNTYGTGAIMAVPAHDTRDYEFAKKFDLPIIQVLDGGDVSTEAFTGDGVHINSGFLNGLNKTDAINKMAEWLEKNKVGKKTVNYRLREWIFARQRYWGEPVPIVHLENGQTYVLTEKELPLTLPELDNYKPGKDGSSPLARVSDWVNVSINGVKGKRETSTMPGSAGSSWYWMRYIDPNNDKAFADPQLLNYWLPVDLYIGGTEHAVGHLLYSRIWSKYLYSKGLVPVKEPFKKLVHQGMILASGGEKMSKRYGNVVNPDDVVNQYGADSLRLYEMFMGPLKDAKPWNTEGVQGVKRFVERIWRLYVPGTKIQDMPNKNLEKLYHETVKKVTNDYEELNFNTAISQLMIFINAVYKENVYPTEYAQNFLKLLNPIAPFVTEELWQKTFKKQTTIAYEPWPTYDESKLVESKVECVIQVNGKFKGKVVVNVDATQQQVVNAIQNSDYAHVLSENVKKQIYVPNKIINFII